MLTNTLSDRQDLYAKHESTEGFFERELRLLLLTNKESAYNVINKNRFRNELREFGRGLYFVETLEDSEKFDIKDRAVVLCRVLIGVSLILTKPNQNITEKYLNTKNCHSVKGYLNMNLRYYIVYNYKQVQDILVLKADTSIVKRNEVFFKCVNHLCKFHGTYHEKECQLFCKQKKCKFYNGYHIMPCELKCFNKNCELFETFHDSDCKIRCTWENCIMFGTYHENKCIHLDHEDSLEFKDEVSDEIIYNKVKFTEMTNKIESKKMNKKIVDKGISIGYYNQKCEDKTRKEIKWNVPSNNCRKQVNEFNKFSSKEFPQLGNNKVQDRTEIKKSNIDVNDYWTPKCNNLGPTKGHNTEIRYIIPRPYVPYKQDFEQNNDWTPKCSNLEPTKGHNTEIRYIIPRPYVPYKQDFKQHNCLDTKLSDKLISRNNRKFAENEYYKTNNEGYLMLDDKNKPEKLKISNPELSCSNKMQTNNQDNSWSPLSITICRITILLFLLLVIFFIILI